MSFYFDQPPSAYHYMESLRALTRRAEEFNRAGLNLAAAYWDVQAQFWSQTPFGGAFAAASARTARNLNVIARMSDYMTSHHTESPGFDIDSTKIGRRRVAVEETRLKTRAFYNLLHFKRDTQRKDPKLLIVAPMSGHYASLLRSTVEALLANHDVHIIDWKNPRDVPKSAGHFDFEKYMDCVIDSLKTLGPDTHVMGISQSTVPILAAAAVLAGQKHRATPASITLIGGPIDTRQSQTKMHEFVRARSLDWFSKNVIDTVPAHYKGAGRQVYPGHMQLAGLLMHGQERHRENLTALYKAADTGDCCTRAELESFYKDYFVMSDLSGRFFLDTLRHVYKEHSLAEGRLSYKGKKVDLSKLNRTGLLTIEGSADEICPPGETKAAHDLCRNIPGAYRKNIEMPGYGHYDIAMGQKFTENVLPELSRFIRNIGSLQGKTYSPPTVIAQKCKTSNPLRKAG